MPDWFAALLNVATEGRTWMVSVRACGKLGSSGVAAHSTPKKLQFPVSIK